MHDFRNKRLSRDLEKRTRSKVVEYRVDTMNRHRAAINMDDMTML